MKIDPRGQFPSIGVAFRPATLKVEKQATVDPCMQKFYIRVLFCMQLQQWGGWSCRSICSCSLSAVEAADRFADAGGNGGSLAPAHPGHDDNCMGWPSADFSGVAYGGGLVTYKRGILTLQGSQLPNFVSLRYLGTNFGGRCKRLV